MFENASNLIMINIRILFVGYRSAVHDSLMQLSVCLRTSFPSAGRQVCKCSNIVAMGEEYFYWIIHTRNFLPGTYCAWNFAQQCNGGGNAIMPAQSSIISILLSGCWRRKGSLLVGVLCLIHK